MRALPALVLSFVLPFAACERPPARSTAPLAHDVYVWQRAHTAPVADAPDATPLADAPEPTAPAEPTESPAAVPAASADGCTAAGLSSTINSVTGALSKYFEKNPDVNAALLDATRQPAFVAVGQMDSYFADHPQQADEVRAIKAPLNDFQNRCGLQVSPAEALVALSDL